jgi:hypothetical protein
MVYRTVLLTLAAAGIAFASDARNLAPAVQGPYLVWLGTLTVNPMDVGSYSALGWRERIYESGNVWLNYNHLGMELFGDLHPYELSVGSRLVVQPTSFLTAALSYRLVNFPNGVASFEGGKRWSESRVHKELWDENRLNFNTFGDEFSLKVSLHKDWGAWQGSLPVEWGRLDIRDELRDSIYIPSVDLIARSRDDHMRVAPTFGYRFDAPFLFGAGVAHTLTWSMDHEIMNQRSGLWYQIWPFSARSKGEMRYWSMTARLDLWTENEYKQMQPRLELSLGWDRNLLQD